MKIIPYLSFQRARKILFAAHLIFALCYFSEAHSQKNNKPNIILILADDLGYGDIGAYGQKYIETPHLNQLAANGKKFTQFYAGTSVCAPSRCSMLTGMHTGHSYIRGNKEIEPEGQWPLKKDAITIAEVLKQNGYITGCFGKWGLGFINTEGDPVNQGFDHFFGYNCQRQAHNYYPTHLWDNDNKIILNNDLQHRNTYSADLIQQQALKFITQNKEQPFFAFLSYTLPHAALELPDNDSSYLYYIKKFNEQPRNVAQNWDGKGYYRPQKFPRAAYAAMVTKLDNYIGQVVELLKNANLLNNTVILFASDNGPHEEGGNDPSYFNSSGGLRGVKRDLYEGGIRVPFIVSWPGSVTGGSSCDNYWAFWDIFPTLSQIAGVTKSYSVDGRSFMPELLNRKSSDKQRALYWEFHENGGTQAVRIGDFKGIRKQVSLNSQAPLELFNLRSDPGETKNIASSHPKTVKKILRIMAVEHKPQKDFPLFPNE